MNRSLFILLLLVTSLLNTLQSVDSSAAQLLTSHEITSASSDLADEASNSFDDLVFTTKVYSSQTSASELIFADESLRPLLPKTRHNPIRAPPLS